MFKLINKSGVGVFDLENKIADVAVDYLADVINKAGDLNNSDFLQIADVLSNEHITLSDKSLLKFKCFMKKNIISKFPKKNDYMMIWTGDGREMNDGTRLIGDFDIINCSKKANIPLESLPKDICMWIRPDSVSVENCFQFDEIYRKSKIK